MRIRPTRPWGLGLIVLIACTGSGTGGGESTTVIVASFGDDTHGATTSTTDVSTTATATVSTTATTTTTTTTTSEATTDPTVDPTVTTDPTAGTEASESTAETTDGGETSSSGDPPPPPPPPPPPRTCATLNATIRDFSVTHPDMSLGGGAVIVPGLVLPTLGMDLVPVLNPEYVGPVVITSADTFAQWYADVPDVNVRIDIELELYEESPSRTVFDGTGFLPIDNQGFGNEGAANNYYFTTTVHVDLVYEGGEVMTFGGDDDVWVFLDGTLIADVGGQHGALFADVALDGLGLEPGISYALDVFHAERGVGGSQLRFELGGFCD